MSIYKGNRLIAGGPNRPYWADAVKLDLARIYTEGRYTAPSNGMLVGWFKFDNHIAILNLSINNITVARSSVINNYLNSEGNVQCPVNKGDYIKLECSHGSVSPNNIVAEVYFVPFIEGYTGN